MSKSFSSNPDVQVNTDSQHLHMSIFSFRLDLIAQSMFLPCTQAFTDHDTYEVLHPLSLSKSCCKHPTLSPDSRSAICNEPLCMSHT